MSRTELLRERLAKRECESIRARFRAAEHEAKHGPDHALVMQAWLDVQNLGIAVDELRLALELEELPAMLAKQAS